MEELGRQLKIGDQVEDHIDEFKNSWYLDKEIVYLKLSNETSAIRIGRIIGEKLIIIKSKEKHLLKVNASFGFNVNVINELKITYLDIYIDNELFRITVKNLNENGEYLFQNKLGYEKQLFLSISYLELYKFVPEEEPNRIKLLGESWYNRLKGEFIKDYMIDLGRFLATRRKKIEVYPESSELFKAFQLCPFDNLKVIILGQDPYFTPGVADGLAFSSKIPTYIPPSLKQVHNAIEKDVYNGLKLDKNPSLTYLAEQGVLLLNTILSVEKNSPKSHENRGWERFVKRVLIEIKENSRDVAVLLWGSNAKNYYEYIDNNRNMILEAEHPAFAVREKRDWINNDCFNKTNQFLINKGYGAIEW